MKSIHLLFERMERLDCDDNNGHQTPGVGTNIFVSTCENIFPHRHEINCLLMATILQGYRSCLTLVRIHPEPFISFHKAAFLGLRSSNVSMQDSGNFLPRFLECMFFNEFIHTRGPPWRKCDIFDDLYSSLGEQLTQEQSDPSRIQVLTNQNTVLHSIDQSHCSLIPRVLPNSCMTMRT